MNKIKEIGFKEALPLSLQHVLAMFVGTIVPPLLIANVAGLGSIGAITLIQAALFASGIATIIQLIPIPFFRKKTGSNLPMMMGMSYVFLGVGISVTAQYGLASLFGGLLVASIVGIFMGYFVDLIKNIFTPVISGVLVLCMGIGLYNPAINNLAGGFGSPTYGLPINFAVGLFVAFLIIFLSKFGRSAIKDSAILIGIVVGYLIAIPLGMVSFSGVEEAAWFALPKPMAYGLEFRPEVIIIFIIAYAIGIIDFMGCCTVTTLGGFDRPLEEKEFSGGVIGAALGSVISALFGALPTAGLSQNAAIISMNKGVHKLIFYIATGLILLTSISPKLAVVLTTIPNAVIGGATLVVFGMIAMAGIMLITMFGFDEETKLIAGISIALSIGISTTPGILSEFPQAIQTLIGGSSIITAVVVAMILQGVFKVIEVRKKKQIIKLEEVSG